MKGYMRVLAFILIGMSQAANAGLIYDVDRSIGAGSVTGFIETDGTMGSLSKANITGWSLDIYAPNINNGVVSSSNTGASIFGDPSLSVTATTTDLFFNFDTFDIFGFWSDSGDDWWCLAGKAGGGCFVSPGESIGYDDGFFGQAQYTSYTGKVSFANVTSVPEPTTIALLSLGLVGIRLRRHK